MIHVVVHSAGGGPGRIADLLDDIAIHRADEGELPIDVGRDDAVVLMGGAEPVEARPWAIDERALIDHCVAGHIPLLGICLGGEAISLALGGRTVRDRRYGWDAAEGLGGTRHVFRWHDFSFTMPPGCVPLFRDSRGRVVGWTRDRVVAVQFHPEMTYAMLRDWTENDPEVMGRARDWLPESHALCAAILEDFVGLLGEQTSVLVRPTIVRAIGAAFGEYQSALATVLAKHGIDAYLAGDRRGAVRLGSDYEELNYSAAREFAASYREEMESGGGSTIRGEFVPWLRDGTEAARSAVVDTVEEGVAAGRGSRAIARDLRRVIDTEAHDPELTARTEMSRLVHAGERQRYKDEGVEFEDYILGDKACDECRANAERDVGYGPGRYPIDEFPEVPVHPGCECDGKAVPPGEHMSILWTGERFHVFQPGHEAFNPDMSRDEVGKFSSGGGVSVAVARAESGQWVTAEGEAPEHIQRLGIPPAWTDVVVNPDPEADLLVKGHDKKGRTQYIYSDRYDAEQQAAKFARVSELSEKVGSIREQNEANRASGSEAADVTALIMETGIRPGSEKDTMGDVRAYGATTLEGRHVVVADEGVRLQFVGKKGVAADIPIEDESVARMLADRAEASGPDGQLFPSVGPNELSEYVNGLDGGGFKTKDFRTLLGTSTAADLVRRSEAPTSKTAYKRAVRAVAKSVAARLGNTPTVALQRYIAPEVFAPWREAAHV